MKHESEADLEVRAPLSRHQFLVSGQVLSEGALSEALPN